MPPHLEKQQEKSLEEYKTNEDPSLQCYGKPPLSYSGARITLSALSLLVSISEPLPSLDMYQTAKRGLQVLIWTDMLKGLPSSDRVRRVPMAYSLQVS